MMAGRILGKGRVLGNPRPTSSSAAGPLTLPPSSDSSASLTSSLSGSTAHDATPTNSQSTLGLSPPQDLVSHVSLPVPHNAAAADASSQLMCPICNDRMVTLLQLNRHLDDLHQNLEEVQQDEVKNWFQAQVDKAKKLPALAVLEKKFRALDVFESNTPPPLGSSGSATTIRGGANGVVGVGVKSGHSTPEPVAPRPRDPEEEVTKKHWQKRSYGDVCSDPLCDKRLGSGDIVNCRCCGKLFCEEHTMYQMKLSRAAQHDPARGVWCRVCETCYKSRAGYNDNKGFERDHTKAFRALRRKKVDQVHLETNRLEKRLTMLTQLLANPPPLSETESRSLLWRFSGSIQSQQRTIEQSVIEWEDDTKVPKCPFCQQEFSNYTFRRSHCRLCGRIVCGDPQTECSTLVGLNVAAEKGKVPIGLDVRMCKDCRHTLFSKADFDREVSLKPPDQRTYENLMQFERGIRLLLPKFHKLLIALQDPDNPPSPTQIAEATKVRKRLTDSFIQYETAARRIRDFTTSSPTQERLQKVVYLQASNFLHLNMLPLKSLPKILKHASPHGASKSRPNGAAGGTAGGALASIRYNDRLAVETSSNPSSSAIESLEAEEKDLREKLIVLEEQKFIVTEMLNSARKGRRFEEMAALSANVDDLSREIDSLTARVLKVEGEFEGLYGEMGAPESVV